MFWSLPSHTEIPLQERPVMWFYWSYDWANTSHSCFSFNEMNSNDDTINLKRHSWALERLWHKTKSHQALTLYKSAFLKNNSSLYAAKQAYFVTFINTLSSSNHHLFSYFNSLLFQSPPLPSNSHTAHKMQITSKTRLMHRYLSCLTYPVQNLPQHFSLLTLLLSKGSLNFSQKLALPPIHWTLLLNPYNYYSLFFYYFILCSITNIFNRSLSTGTLPSSPL